MRVVRLLEGFLEQMYSDETRNSDERRSCHKTLLSKCLEVMERFGDRKAITCKLSGLLAPIWTINRNCFGEEAFVALQNMYSMRKYVAVIEMLSLLLYGELPSGNVDKELTSKERKSVYRTEGNDESDIRDFRWGSYS